MKRKTLALLFALAVLPWSHADDPKTKNEEPDENWMQTYYQKPTPERFETEVRKLQKTGVLSKPNTIIPMTAFLSRLFAMEDDRLPKWLTVADAFPEKDRQVFILALHWANTDASRKALDAYTKAEGDIGDFARKVARGGRPDFKDNAHPSPEELDGCWASFFATGEAAYVHTVIRCATAPQQQGRIDLAHHAARWSLKSLCRMQAPVLKIKDDFYKTATAQQKASLDALFKEKRPPNKTNTDKTDA